MADIFFNGTQNVSVEFNPEDDQVVLSGLDASDIASFTEEGGSVRLVTLDGSILTLQGVTFAQLDDEDFVSLNGNVDIAIGSSIGEALTGNVVVGLAGADTIINDADTTSTVVGGDDGALLFGNQGNDSINGGGADDLRIFGGQGNDTIDGFGSGSVVYGGINEVFNPQGTETLTADAGTAGEEGVTIFGGNGGDDTGDLEDSITGSEGDDALFGNGGEDTINSFGGSDLIYGGRNDDDINLVAASGGSTVFGGLGDDSITATDATEGVTIYGGNGSEDAADGNDTILGGAGDDLLVGNAGNDSIAAGGGEDTIYGGLDSDIITGTVESGAQIFGGLGTDQITVTVAGGDDDAGTQISGGNGSVDAADGEDLINVSNASGDVSIFGNGGDDQISISGDGDFVVFGGQGDDIITVNGNSNYTVTGGAGADTFSSVTPASDEVAPAYEPQDADDVGFITDVNFDIDQFEFVDATLAGAGGITGTADLTDFTPGAGDEEEFAAIEESDSLIEAANAAVDFAIEAGLVEQSDAAGDSVSNVAVAFTFEGESYLAVDAFANDPFLTGETAAGTGVDGIVRITGFTGTIDTDDFSVSAPAAMV
jgi:Ca2+-binding RTX toxin-like protein